MDISIIVKDIVLDTSSSQPLYLQIADHIAAKIQENLLPAGTKLPPERELAKLFQVSRTTAINAYRQLEKQELITIRVGSGTYVCRDNDTLPSVTPMPWTQLLLPHLNTPISSILRSLIAGPVDRGNSISLAAGMPDPNFYPAATFQRLFQEHLSQLDLANFGHLATEGYQPLRESIAAICRQKGMAVNYNHILILSGSQQGLYLTAKALLEPEDYVVVESPTYLGAIQVFQSSSARILCLPPSDGGNIPLDILEDYLIRYRPKLFYTIPTYQNPSGRVLPLEERQKLLALAARHRLIILEDDPYGELYYEEVPPPSLKALDHYGGVLYLGTLSKVLFPGLRTGWIAGPQVVINRLAQEKQYNDLHCNTVTQWLVHRYLQENLLPAHIESMRREYKKRRNAMLSSIRRFCGDSLTCTMPHGGFYLWCNINRQISCQTLLHETSKAGVSFVPGEAFYATPSGTNEIRLCFATHPETVLAEGIKRLAKVLHALPEAGKAEYIPAFYTGRPII
ncbi:hypothetical protein P22_2009 [Propionispora sp. 2/2-37]|uniref:MocR-like pyridoxine biosynthesis transcription factor PdxR n=1 Tax=Propionispora sp. 2/2-37 TaxID=1677858 RepID=UPI0006BB7C66|nr:PLP-dependent aminotransferase family protein [Propionispora sp. 2/2-37]CUH95921.1 hypothetical protein P22_2009 [Propionispora sp. 2/2-37]